MEWQCRRAVYDDGRATVHALMRTEAADTARGTNGIFVGVMQSLPGYFITAEFGSGDAPTDFAAVMAEGLAAAKAWEAENPAAPAEREV